jgi:hypothetical protein
MTVNYQLEVQTKGINGVDLKCVSTIPFVPQIGMWLIATGGDDYRKVESVYWSPEDGLQVFFEFDELAKLKSLLKLGWLVAVS